MTRKHTNYRKFDREQGQWHSVDPQTIQELSSTRSHQECLQACQQHLQSEPENPLSWKYAGKSLLAMGQFEKAQQCLIKAHQLDATDPETTKDIGDTYLNLSSTDNATKWYKKSLEINNSYAPALNNLANIKRQSGNTQEAIDLFKRAIQIDPKLIQAYVGAAASLLALRDLDQAEALTTKAIEINAHAPGINEILGMIFQNKDSHEKAIEHYRNELAINPKASNSLLNLGLLLLHTGQAAEAIEPLIKASANNPSEQSSLLLAEAYQNLGQFKEAIIEYKKLDFDQPKNKIIPFNLGLCLLNTGSNLDAIEAFKLAIKIDQSFLPAWGNIGNALKNEGRHHEALLATQKVLDLDPNNPDAHINLGSIYKDLGNLDQALASTLKSLELRPNNPTAHMNLGSIYKDLGNIDQALAYTLKSLELRPDNPTAHMNLGGFYKDLGNLDQALAYTLKSLELKPNNPYALVNLGGIYKQLGRLDQALASTLKSLELKPNNPDAHTHLGGIYRQLGRLDQALASTLKSLELKPNNPDAHTNLGEIYFETADHKKAEEEFNLAIELNRQAKDSATRGKAACSFIKKDYIEAIELIESMPSEEYAWRNNSVPREAELKSIIDAKQKKEAFCGPTGEVISTTNIEDDKSLIKVTYREVTDSLITELYGISTRKLSQTKTNDARNGSGFCTDFNLLSNNSPQIKQLEADLTNIIKKHLRKNPCSLKYDSFFNIFKAGAGTTPHRHLNSQDKKFNLWKHKYSLVYYIDPGDQACDQPGTLKMHEPEEKILPKKGMIIIIPATRPHSSNYGGSKDRLMVGANFYAFDPNTEQTI